LHIFKIFFHDFPASKSVSSNIRSNAEYIMKIYVFVAKDYRIIPFTSVMLPRETQYDLYLV